MTEHRAPDEFIRGAAAAIAEFARQGGNVVLAGDILASLELERADLEGAEIDQLDLDEIYRLI